MKPIEKIADWIPETSSIEVRDAFRLSIQSSIAAASTWLILSAFEMPEKFVGVLSAALVMKVTIGSTLTEGKQRLYATVVGCAAGAACLFFIPHGYGTAIALAVSVGLVSLLAGIKSEWGYGIVGAVALAIGSQTNLVDSAQERLLSILLGVTVGVTFSMVLFPVSSKQRASMHIEHSFRAISDYIQRVVSWISTHEGKNLDECRSRYSKHISSARESLSGLKNDDRQKLGEKIDAVDRLYNSVVIMKRVGERTDDYSISNDEVSSRLSHMAEEIETLLDQVLENKPEAEDGLNHLSHDLTELQSAASEGPNKRAEQEESQTLAFAMKEVTDVIEDLASLYDVSPNSSQG